MDATPLDAALPSDAPDSLVEHAAFVRRVAFAVLRDDDDADDAAQEALVRGLETGPSDPAARRSWLATVVRNVARRLRRTRSRVTAREHAAARPEPTLSAADAAARSETIRRVGEAVAALSEPGRTAVLLRHYDGLPPREIAARLGVPVETVKSRLRRAHEDLRSLLESKATPGSTPWRAVLAAFAGLGVDGAPLPSDVSAPADASPLASAATATKVAVALGVVVTAGAVAWVFGVRGPGTTERPPSAETPQPHASPPRAPELAPGAIPLAPSPETGATTPTPAPARTSAPTPPLVLPAPAPTPPAPTAAAGTSEPLPSKPLPTPGRSLAAAGPAPGATPPAPSGMVWVDVTTATPRVGSTAAEVLLLGEKRSKDVQSELSYEVPLHDVALRPYFLDQFEVTNAQYLRFLDDTAKATLRTGAGALATLEEIASYLAYGTAKGAEQAKDSTSWAQLYELNRKTLVAALPGLSKADFRRTALPPDLELVGYHARLPRLWFADSDRLEGDAAPNHPVRDVSYVEAEAFAEWAGKHIPTEEEFEWALRGPKGLEFPWGDDWAEGVENGKRIVESRCNWADLGKTSTKTFEPTTVAVDEMPEGRSWCGAFHLVGNVSEWTSSWFDVYPGWPGDPKDPWQSYRDHYVRVIRGGSCADRERIALRAAHRNFIGVARLEPPIPSNHFDYTGFRCAQYLTPALDRLEPAIERMLRPKKVRRELIAADRFAGTAVVHFAPAGTTPENHVHVTGASSAIFLAPLTSIFGLAPAAEAARAADDKAAKVELERPWARSAAELLAYAPGPDEEPAVLGVFHTDVDLADVRLSVADAAAPKGHSPPRRGKAAMPATKRGDLARGTYVLGLAHGSVALYRSNLDLVAFVGKLQIAEMTLKKGEAPPATSVEVDPAADLLRCRFWIAIGGKGPEPGEGVLLTFAANTVAGQLEKARGDSSWR